METNIFKLLEIETKENIHSSFIASIINSSDYAKDKFIKMLYDVSKRNFDYEKLKAQTEITLSTKGAGRVDIYLTDYKKNKSNGNTRIIIENKIYAGDQPKQLDRYHKHLERYENTALFYLTIEGKDAASYSRKELAVGKNYYLLNYADHIEVWLKSVLKNGCIEPNLEIYINDYLEVIKELTKYNSLLKDGVNKKELNKNELEEFNALLELRFWQTLEEKILEKYDGQYFVDYQHRYYSYTKTLKSQKGKKDMPRDYGLVIKANDNTKNIRISVAPKNPQKLISIRIGQFENNEWKNTNDVIVNDEKLNTLNLTKTEYMEENHIKKIIEAIEKIQSI